MLKINPPHSTEDQFRALFKALDMVMMPTKGSKALKNNRGMSRILGVDIRTVNKLRESYDPWPWWPIVFTKALEYTLPYAELWKRRAAYKILREQDYETLDAVDKACSARDWLFDQLKYGPEPAAKLLLPANRQDISKRRIRAAAQRMGVIVTRMGKGREHNVTWELPSFGYDD